MALGLGLQLRGTIRPLSRVNCKAAARNGLLPSTRRFNSSKSITLNGQDYPLDSTSNVPASIIPLISRNLHLQQNHPLSITRSTIEQNFDSAIFSRFNDISPIVSVAQNFDSLGFPADHPGRATSDTYYVNSSTVLRTHTSAHQVETFKRNKKEGYLITADVYRRDAIDRSHYPVFHQMEGARMFTRDAEERNGKHALLDAVNEDLLKMAMHDVEVLDCDPSFDLVKNPVQDDAGHTVDEAIAVGNHLKRSLELVVADIFGRARTARISAGMQNEEELKIRWVETYFPFTSPSWEMEVWWQGDWLELLGCGVVKHKVLSNAGVSHKMGWAFGLGLERIAMLLFGIPDIRLFWSIDDRFLRQFDDGEIACFKPFSKHPACHKDVAFWLPKEIETTFHENDFMEIVRNVAGNNVEDVKLLDEFTHPKTQRKSKCFRVNYRSHERTLTNIESNSMHENVRNALARKFNVELR